MPVLLTMFRSPLGVMLFVALVGALFHLHCSRLSRTGESKRT